MKDNTLNKIGDVLLIDVLPKITGKILITDFSDDIEGVTASRTVRKEFRVSSDRIFWNDWKELNADNLSSEEYSVDNSLLIQLRYTRNGTDDSGIIKFNSIDFIGTREEIKINSPTTDASIFSDIINTPEIKNLENNLFKKLYFRGIVPEYITRGDNVDEKEDEDYIDLFSSVAKFYSMIISFSKRFENFYNDFDLMREQVRQGGIYFDESNITLEELQYLSKNFYDQIRQRGTEMIFKRKGYPLPNGSVLQIDGEFIRLIRNKSNDELLYENIPLERMGWCLGKSSPMYRGTSNSENLNKTKESTKDFQNLSNFALFSNGNASYAIKTYDGKRVLNLKSASGGKAGLGRQNENGNVSEHLCVVDSKLDYEITFAFRIIGNPGQGSVLTFGVEGFDSLKNKLNDSFVTPNGFSVSETFFTTDVSNKKNSVWYYVRGIIHAYSTENIEESLTNMGIGTNLYFNNPFVKYISPNIQITSSSNFEINIWDYKIRPLVRGTNIQPLKNGIVNSHSLGFIQNSNMFYSYVRNNNNNLSHNEITDIINEYLLPYNVTGMFIFTDNN